MNGCVGMNIFPIAVSVIGGVWFFLLVACLLLLFLGAIRMDWYASRVPERAMELRNGRKFTGMTALLLGVTAVVAVTLMSVTDYYFAVNSWRLYVLLIAAAGSFLPFVVWASAARSEERLCRQALTTVSA